MVYKTRGACLKWGAKSPLHSPTKNYLSSHFYFLMLYSLFYSENYTQRMDAIANLFFSKGIFKTNYVLIFTRPDIHKIPFFPSQELSTFCIPCLSTNCRIFLHSTALYIESFIKLWKSKVLLDLN